MKRFLVLLIVVFLLFPAVLLARHASRTDAPVPTSTWSDIISQDNPETVKQVRALAASAAVTTTVLNSSQFDSGYSCTANGLTTVDLDLQTGDWWHVDDFSSAPWAGTKSTGGIAFNAVQGTKSMWMAALPPAASPVNTILCSYAKLPGYGNGWDQAFCSKACLTVSGGPTPNLDVAFKLKFDSE